MKSVSMFLPAVLVAGIYTSCFAGSCNCADWMERSGYCVDYVHTRIPSFPIPYRDDMPNLKNTDVSYVTEGDVAIFTIKDYWHVAYVEKVYRDEAGDPTAIDVSEMNFGDDLSYAEFKERWKSRNKAEWNRALCCGITDKYGEVTYRKNVPISTLKQLWSPDDVDYEGGKWIKSIVGKVREIFDEFDEFTE